ncbi:hypothetical protein Scep_007066 [Stephania cephalantha]|uniref:Uncharacterized protein n=1 Tax=Stephania cephalantha TaxID=152367 RepID=A0AAP0KB65_9MAGN
MQGVDPTEIGSLSKSLSPKSAPQPQIAAVCRSWGLCRRLRVDVASAEVVPIAVLAQALPPLVAAVRCRVETKVVCLGPLGRWCASPAAVSPLFVARCRGTLFDRRASGPLPSHWCRPMRSPLFVASLRASTASRRVRPAGVQGYISKILVLGEGREPLLERYVTRDGVITKNGMAAFEAEDCLEKEKERVYQYLHSSSEEKLLGEDDLIKMYWLFYRIPQGLDTIANIFKKDTINLSEFLTYIAQVGILNNIQQSKAIKKGNRNVIFVSLTVAFFNHLSLIVDPCRISSKGDVGVDPDYTYQISKWMMSGVLQGGG